MKHSILPALALVIPLLHLSTLDSFTIYNSSFAYENLYNANSFIFNCNRYSQHYTPSHEALGDEAIEKLESKKNKPKKGRRLFTRYACEK